MTVNERGGEEETERACFPHRRSTLRKGLEVEDCRAGEMLVS